MKIRNLVVSSLLVAGALGVPTLGQARVDVDINVGPPSPRVEVVPNPRAGYVWAPGYWRWEGHRHVWARGHWVRERHGYHWVPEHWARHEHRWRFERGHWDRD